MLSDYMSGDIKTKKILSNAIKENIPQKLYDIKALNENDRDISIAKIKVFFKEDNGMEEAIANSVVDCFIYGLGWKSDSNCFNNTDSRENIRTINYEELTIEQCLSLAANNDSSALLQLGKIYYNGVIVSKDLKKSFDYELRAANLGNAEAMHDVGFCYQHGEGTQKDIPRAYDWYVKSMELGFYKAYFRLGRMYEDGIYCSLDFKKAMEYYLISAKAGYSSAMFSIAYMYGTGKGIERNYEQAIIWYEKAAKLNHITAMYNLGYYYESGGYGIQKNDVEAFRWYLKAAEKNYAHAQLKISRFFHSGIVTEVDEEKEIYWLEKSAEKYNRSALFILGKYCHWGRKNCPINLKKAKKCFMEVVKEGYYEGYFIDEYADAHYNIAQIISKGDPVNEVTNLEKLAHVKIAGEYGNLDAQKLLAKSYKKGNKPCKKVIKLAYYWYEKAAENGDADSQYIIGMAFYQGMHKEKDYKQAVSWLEKSAVQNNPKAVTKLGTCYMDGEGVAVDIKKAIALFEKAKELGDFDAAYYLGYIYNNGIGTDRNLELAKINLESALNHNIYKAVEELNRNFREKSDGTWVKKLFR